MTRTSSRDYAAEAWSQLPGHDQLAAAVDRLHELRIPQPRHALEVQTQLRERIAAGEQVTGEQIVAELAAALAAAQAADTAHAFVAGLHQELPRRLDHLRRSGADTALKWLQSELAAALTRASKVIGSLDGVRTADDAIERGATKEWSALTQLAAEYAGIRTAQREITITGIGEGPNTITMLETFGVVAEPEQLHPRLQRELEGRDPISLLGPGAAVSVTEAEPWPADPLEQLLWAHTDGAQLVIPKLAELRDAATAHATAARAARNDNTGAPLPDKPTAAMDRELTARRNAAWLEEQRAAGAIA